MVYVYISCLRRYDYKDIASDEDIQLANAIREANIHALPEGMEKKHCVRNAYVYKGMTLENFYTYTKDFLNQDHLNIPESQIIGSSATVIASGQGDIKMD